MSRTMACLKQLNSRKRQWESQDEQINKSAADVRAGDNPSKFELQRCSETKDVSFVEEPSRKRKRTSDLVEKEEVVSDKRGNNRSMSGTTASPNQPNSRKRQRETQEEQTKNSPEDVSAGDNPSKFEQQRCGETKDAAFVEEPSGKRKRTSNLAEREEVALDKRAEFEAKYQQLSQLGDGGYGCVFAGFRKADNLPVAIKHIAKDKQPLKHVVLPGGQTVCSEVAVMKKLMAKARSMSAFVSLLDWYDLDTELILVLERPVPCQDLFDYCVAKGGSLQEEEAKIILQQLVEAGKELLDASIFHRDIKIENILIEMRSKAPCVRVIDFGLSCIFKKNSSYNGFYGTACVAPPEWIRGNTYTPHPTTVWQIGAVLFDLLHKQERFESRSFLSNKLKISNQLSKNCQDFLEKCLSRDPEKRPTLQQLRRHPWLS